MKTKKEALIEAVKLEMSKYGFKLDFSAWTDNSNSITCNFKPEMAIGMAAFSQTKNVVSFTLFDPEDETETVLVLSISVTYDHVEGGTNGYSINYYAIPFISAFGDGKIERFDLLRVSDYNKALGLYNRKNK